MKKTIIGITLLLTSLVAYANCTTNTIIVGNKYMVCTTCCVDGNCTTTCL